MSNKIMKTPKYPRIIVSPDRHAKLQQEAKEKKTTLQKLTEEKFKVMDGKKK